MYRKVPWVRIPHSPPFSLCRWRRRRGKVGGPLKARVFAGFWEMALAKPDRRRWGLGLEEATFGVCLCCEVGRFGFALDSPESPENPELFGFYTLGNHGRFNPFKGQFPQSARRSLSTQPDEVARSARVVVPHW